MRRPHLLPLLAMPLLTTGGGPEKNATYETVEGLKEAYVDAGGVCDDWSQTNAVEIAAQSGECGESTVLSVYLSSEAVERRIEATKGSMFAEIMDDWLVGENWIIHADDATDLQGELGGRIVSFSSSE